jgi:hypothetical protein
LPGEQYPKSLTDWKCARWSDIFIGNIRQEGLHNAKSGSIYEFGYGTYLDLQVKGRD